MSLSNLSRACADATTRLRHLVRTVPEAFPEYHELQTALLAMEEARARVKRAREALKRLMRAQAKSTKKAGR